MGSFRDNCNTKRFHSAYRGCRTTPLSTNTGYGSNFKDSLNINEKDMNKPLIKKVISTLILFENL